MHPDVDETEDAEAYWENGCPNIPIRYPLLAIELLFDTYTKNEYAYVRPRDVEANA